MDKRKYREAIDQLSFSEDFEARTIELLRQKAQPATGKEKRTMKRKVFWRAAIAVCLVAVLSVGGFAAGQLLSTREASQYLDNDNMRAAFSGENVIEINETQVMGDYSVTVLGIAPGEDLRKYGATNSSHNYVMMAFQGTNGASVEDFLKNFKVTPLVSGYSVEMDFVLGQKLNGILLDNVWYVCYDISNLELFADRDVSLAIYKQKFPVDVDGAVFYQAGDVFTALEDGTIAFREDFPEEHAMFTLPLDESKADPEAAERLIDEDIWSDIADLRDPDWRSEDKYSENYHEMQQKALEEAGLK